MKNIFRFVLVILHLQVSASELCSVEGKFVTKFYKNEKEVSLSYTESEVLGGFFVNRLDYYELKIEGQIFHYKRDKLLITGDKRQIIDHGRSNFFSFMDTIEGFKYEDYYFLKFVTYEIDWTVERFVVLDKNLKELGRFTPPCGYNDKYFSKTKNGLAYICKYSCFKENKSFHVNLENFKLVPKKDSELCKNFETNKRIEISTAKRILKKSPKGERYKAEVILPKSIPPCSKEKTN